MLVKNSGVTYHFPWQIIKKCSLGQVELGIICVQLKYLKSFWKCKFFLSRNKG